MILRQNKKIYLSPNIDKKLIEIYLSSINIAEDSFIDDILNED